MPSASTWQSIRLLFAIILVWVMVTYFSILIEGQDCSELLLTSGEYPTSNFQYDQSQILPGLSMPERMTAVSHTDVDAHISGDMRKMQIYLTKQQGIISNLNHNNVIWNDIRIGNDYVCCYRDPSDADNNVGRPFPMNSYVQEVWYKYMTSATIFSHKTEPYAVTALSDNRFREFEESVGTFLDNNHRQRVLYEQDNDQAEYTQRKVVIYDLGLSPENVQKIKSNSQFIYKKFRYERYPEHVKDLSNFAWKILLWAEVLHDYGALIWFDTSINWIGNVDELLHTMRSKQECYKSAIEERHHTIAYGVHPMMYTFFPSNITSHMYPYNMMKTAGVVVIFNTETCKSDIIRWAMLCALNKDCIAPEGSRKECPEGTNKYQPHICHRYDQALLSILLANRYGVLEENQSWYYAKSNHLLADNQLGGSEHATYGVDKEKWELLEDDKGSTTSNKWGFTT